MRFRSPTEPPGARSIFLKKKKVLCPPHLTQPHNPVPITILVGPYGNCSRSMSLRRQCLMVPSKINPPPHMRPLSGELPSATHLSPHTGQQAPVDQDLVSLLSCIRAWSRPARLAESRGGQPAACNGPRGQEAGSGGSSAFNLPRKSHSGSLKEPMVSHLLGSSIMSNTTAP